MDKNGHVCIAVRMRINTDYKVCVYGMRKMNKDMYNIIAGKRVDPVQMGRAHSGCRPK